MLYYFK
ncbi:uncharacterized protein FFNC_12537 [Fusarium fujikuroi]|nr:uncharacterized protein FFNC_12537 [Fusarium fujikuroi]